MPMRKQEVYFDIMSAVGHALRGKMSASKSVHTYSFSLKSTGKFGSQVRFNFGLGEGELDISQMLTLMPVKKGA